MTTGQPKPSVAVESDPMPGRQPGVIGIAQQGMSFADAATYIADPAHADVPIDALLSEQHAAARRDLIQPDRAMRAVTASALPIGSDTVYLTVVDAAGNAVSLINSLYSGFGSGVTAGDTGIMLQNRGACFVLDPAHRNCLAPGKRPYHTIIPCMVLRGDRLWSSFGVMGGFMQPQGHVQVVVGLVDDGLDPQAALDRPRFCIQPATAGGTVALEAGLPAALVDGLRARGHPLQPGVDGYDRAVFGRGQIIRRMPDGVLWGGSDPRADGCALGF